MEEYSDISSSISQGDIFKSPKVDPSAFVARRSKYSTLPDHSPLPDAFCNVADEDMWVKMNNGYIADLDSLQTTPPTNRKVQSFPTSDATVVSSYLLIFFPKELSFMFCSCISFVSHPSTSPPKGTKLRVKEE